MKRLAISMLMTALLATLAVPLPAQAPPPKRAQVEADLANLLSQEAELKDQASKIETRDRDETEKNAAAEATGIAYARSMFSLYH